MSASDGSDTFSALSSALDAVGPNAATTQGRTKYVSTFDGITWPDYLVIVIYFGFVFAVGIIVRYIIRLYLLQGQID